MNILFTQACITMTGMNSYSYEVHPRGFVLTDEGHTMMWLSYEEYNFIEARERLLDRIIGQNNVQLDRGRICVIVDTPSKVGPALLSLIQAVMQVSNLRYLSRSNVTNTFLEDIRTAFRESDLKQV